MKKPLLLRIHCILTAVYLIFVLFLPRVGSHLKVSELLVPFLVVSTLIQAYQVQRVLTNRILALCLLFFLLVIVSNALSFVLFGTNLIYLMILPIRFVEILLMLFAVPVAVNAYPKQSFMVLFYSFLVLFGYTVLNVVFAFQPGYYGLVVLPGETGPYQVGITFVFFVLFFLWIYLAKYFLLTHRLITPVISRLSLLLFGLSLFLVLLNVQRTSILAVIFCTVLSLLLALFIRYKDIIMQNLKLMSLLGLSAVAVVYLVNLLGGDLLNTLLYVARRFEAFDSASNIRITRWISFFNLDPWSGLTSFFGVGLGSHNFFYGTGDFTLRFDSLPLRLLFETGIFGLLAFIALHAVILIVVYKRSRIIGLFTLLLFLFMSVMSITFEAPFVYVPGTMFYTLVGLSIGISYHLSVRTIRTIKVAESSF